METKVTLEELKVSIQKLCDEQQKATRRIDTLQKTADLLFADREILENVVGRLTSLEERINLSRQHDDLANKDLKAEIQISGDRVGAKVETKVEEIKEIVKKKRKFYENPLKISIFSSFFNKLRGGETL